MTTRVRAARAMPKGKAGEVVSWLVTLVLAGVVFALVKFTGLSLLVVTTDSMEPTLMPRDFVVTLSTRVVEPEVGAVVVFEPSFNGATLPAHIHRIVGGNPDGTWTTQGDNANGPDPWLVTGDQITAVATGITIPHSLTQNPWLYGVGAFILALTLLWPKTTQTPRARGRRSARRA